MSVPSLTVIVLTVCAPSLGPWAVDRGAAVAATVAAGKLATAGSADPADDDIAAVEAKGRATLSCASSLRLSFEQFALRFCAHSAPTAIEPSRTSAVNLKFL